MRVAIAARTAFHGLIATLHIVRPDRAVSWVDGGLVLLVAGVAASAGQGRSARGTDSVDRRSRHHPSELCKMPSAIPGAIVITAFTSDSDHPAAHRLCPTCGSPTIRITTTMLVHFDVIYESSVRDFSVIDEMLGDAMWDDGTDASCQLCRWRGTVGDLRRRH